MPNKIRWWNEQPKQTTALFNLLYKLGVYKPPRYEIRLTYYAQVQVQMNLAMSQIALDLAKDMYGDKPE